MKIGFVYPSIESLGIEYLSASLKNNHHQTALILDPCLFNDDVSHNRILNQVFSFRSYVIDKIISSGADLIAFSVVSNTYPWACSLASEIKKITNKPIIFGGIHVTFLPGDVLKNDFVDFICAGDGEDALVELADKLEQGKAADNIKGIGFKRNGNPVINDLARPIDDLDSVPFPDKELYRNIGFDFNGNYRTMASRNCLFSCGYCYNNRLKKIHREQDAYYRVRSADNIVKELRIAKEKHKFNYVVFDDDLFPFDSGWLETFASLYKQEIGKPFWCHVHPLTVTKDRVGLLRQAGCVSVGIGLDSVSNSFNKDVFNRDISADKIKNSIDILRQYGVQISGTYIIASQHRGIEGTLSDAVFYSENKVDSMSPFMLTFYPGTEIGGVKYLEYVKWRRSIRPNRVDRDFFKISLLFYLSCLLPARLARFIVAKKLYLFFPSVGLVSVIRTLSSLRNAIKYKRFHFRFSFIGRLRFYSDYIFCRMPVQLLIKNMRSIFMRKPKF